MKRHLITFACAVLLAATACGTAAPEPGVSLSSAPDSNTGVVPSSVPNDDADLPFEDSNHPGESAPGNDDAVESNNDDDPAIAPSAVPDGPIAPNVTLDLDDGTTFVLADAQRPVMFVFWAEW